MKAGVFVAENGEVYVDKKRRMWFFSLLIPVIGITGPALFMATGQELWLWAVFVFVYVFFPLMDFILGEDTSNPPESVVPQLEADPFYARVARLHVPIVIGVTLFLGWFVGTYELSWSGIIATALIGGSMGGHGLNIGHELGHKRDALNQWLSKIVLAPAAYGHFFIEHNKGHHKHVATPEDPASSKMGEHIYQFALRELPGAIHRAYTLEKQRLHDEGKSQWSVQNEFLQTTTMTLGFYLAMGLWLGPEVVPYLILSAFWSMWQLTTANYIEHYGLLRQKLPSGRYEPPKPHHSWNSNHLFSNWALFHLQRHSDHHANPTRSYQSLRNFAELPSLPSGYFGMYPIAYVPWLWFKVMDKRLLKAVNSDPKRINFLPEKRDYLMQKYGLAERVEDVMPMKAA